MSASPSVLTSHGRSLRHFITCLVRTQAPSSQSGRAYHLPAPQLQSLALVPNRTCARSLTWAVQHFRDDRANAQLNSVYLPYTPRTGHVISEPRLPPALAQFTSSGGREPGNNARCVEPHNIMDMITGMRPDHRVCFHCVCNRPLCRVLYALC